VQTNAALQMVGQLGRGLGPIIATQWYDGFVAEYGKRGGYNAANLFNLFFFVLACTPMLCVFTDVWGTFNDPSPAAQRAAKPRQTTMI